MSDDGGDRNTSQDTGDFTANPDISSPALEPSDPDGGFSSPRE